MQYDVPRHRTEVKWEISGNHLRKLRVSTDRIFHGKPDSVLWMRTYYYVRGS